MSATVVTSTPHGRAPSWLGRNGHVDIEILDGVVNEDLPVIIAEIDRILGT